MEEMDDFGDLYADVDVHVNVGFGNFDRLHAEEEEKNDRDLNISEKREIEVDSVCRDNNVNEDVERLVGSDAELPGLEADNENLIAENGSDSEDDLHIVLNEEDCRMFPTSRVRSILNREFGAGSDDEEEDDDLVIVAETAGLNKDQKWVDPMQLSADGLDESNGGTPAERGNTLKGGYLSQYSQFKYVRHHAAVFPSVVRTNESGGVVSFSSPLSSRGDWDVKGASQQNTFSMTSITQNGFGFSLPRNRTILDLSIETFEWKPWRHPGVDITDYFNYGLEEESWKNYCKSMDNLRQQTAMQTKIPVYESSRLSQAYEAEFLQKTAALETPSDEIAQVGLSERVSSVTEYGDCAARSSEIPRGRAILVEGGTGERMPSMDVRRPRLRDSDVVIQIAVQDSIEDSASGKEETKHIDETLLDTLENVGFEDDLSIEGFGSSSGDRQPTDGFSGCSSRNSEPKVEHASSYLDNDHRKDRATDLEKQHTKKAKEPIPEGNCKALETMCGSEGAGTGYSIKADKEADLASDSGMQHSLTPSNTNSSSGQPNTGIPAILKTDHHSTRQTSSSVASQQEPIMSESHHSNDSRSVTSKTDEENRDSYQKQHPIRGEHNHCSRVRLCSGAESKNPLSDGGGSSRANRKDRQHRAHLRCEMQKKKQHNYYSNEEEDQTHYRKTKMSVRYHGRGSASKQTEQNSHTELFHRKDDLHSREEMKPSIRRSQNEWEYFHKRRDNEISDREFYHPDRGASSVSCKDSKLLPTSKITYARGEGYMLRERNSENGRYLGKRAGHDLFELECRYREEFFEEKCGRDVPYYDREEPFQEKYRRRIPCYGREEKSIHEKYRRHASHLRRELLERQERDDRNLHFDAVHSPSSVDHDGSRYWKHPDGRPWSPQTIREFHAPDGRGWQDYSPKHHMYGPRRLDGRHGDDWGPHNFQELDPKKMREGDDFISISDEHHYLSHDNDYYFGRGDHDTSGCPVYHKDVIYNEKKRYSWLSKAADWSDNQASVGHHGQDSSYDPIVHAQYGRNSRHWHDRFNHNFGSGGWKHSANHYLERRKNIATEEESRHSEVRKHIGAVSDIDGIKVEARITKCRKSVELHLNDWEGKHPRRYSRIGDIRYDRHSRPANLVVDKEPAPFRDPDESHTGKETLSSPPKVVHVCPRSISSKIERLGQCSSDPLTDHSNEKWLDKYPLVQDQEGQTPEEGQLVPEEPESEDARAGQRKWRTEKTSPTSAIQMKKPCRENAVNDNKVAGEYDNQRILETLAKMEKRRERFKEPIALKKEPDKSAELLPEPVGETAEIQAQRPARKRRWGGS